MYTMIWGLFFLPMITISSTVTTAIPAPAARYETESECEDAARMAKPAKDFQVVCMPVSRDGHYVGEK